MNILAIGAHPDDIELGCFGTLKLHNIKGDRIFGIVMTNGEKGGNPKMRKQESKCIAKMIDMKIFFGNFPDGVLKDDIYTVGYIEKKIEKYDIDVVYTHSIHDRHQDHRNLALATISASRFVNQVYSFETPSSISQFFPQVFIDITKTFSLKKKALSMQQTQGKKYYMEIESIEGLAKYRGFQAGKNNTFCEAFEVIRVMKSI